MLWKLVLFHHLRVETHLQFKKKTTTINILPYMFRRRPDNDPTVGSPSLIARPVTGTIRPPPSYPATTTTSTIISRQQHIESYLRDPTLAPSTRKVSDGT